MKRLSLCSAALLTLLSACHPDETTIDTTGVEPPASWNSIPESHPSGRIHGVDFEMRSARIRITDKPDRKWVTIILSAAASEEPCGPLEPKNAPSVWIRIPGPPGKALAVQEMTRAASEDDTWSVHYQVPRDDSPWIGRSHAAALFAIRRTVAGFGIDAELAACFADGMESCVSGTFTARSCPSPVSPDVRKIDPAPRMPDSPSPTASASVSTSASSSSQAETPPAPASSSPR
jgi:hypothetical protein